MTVLAKHSERVGELAARLTERVVHGSRWVALMRMAGQLHDLGMIGIRDDIFFKDFSLSADEWEIMRRHPDIGADLLSLHPSLAPVAPIVRHHHERWDGSGYPTGLKGDVAPLGARILAVAESFDHITHRQFHRATRMTPEEAVKNITERAGLWYDPAVVEALRTTQQG